MAREPKSVDEIRFVAPEVAEPEIPRQPEFYKLPTRFGSIPVDEAPLGWEVVTRTAEKKVTKFRHAYPVIRLPFQEVQRIEFGHGKEFPPSELFPTGANRLFFGDNLHVMRQLAPNSIDLIYIDPPFFSGKQYNVIFGDKNEVRSFNDIWEGGMPGYLLWLNARLVEMKRLLKPTGSIYVHLDWHAAHYVKVEMDKILGYENFCNEIIWHYSGWNRKLGREFNKRHDVILFYGKSPRQKFHSYAQPWETEDAYVRRRKQKVRVDSKGRKYVLSDAGGGKRIKRYLEDAMREGAHVDDVWDMDKLNNSDKEAIGYPTQKPERLLERVILSATDEGDIVADFFCGGGDDTGSRSAS